MAIFQTDRREKNGDKPNAASLGSSTLWHGPGCPPMQDAPSFPGRLHGNDATGLLTALHAVHLSSYPSCFVQRLISPLLALSAELKSRVASLLLAQITSYEAWLGLGGQLPGFESPTWLSWPQWSFVCDQRVLGVRPTA